MRVLDVFPLPSSLFLGWRKGSQACGIVLKQEKGIGHCYNVFLICQHLEEVLVHEFSASSVLKPFYKNSSWIIKSSLTKLHKNHHYIWEKKLKKTLWQGNFDKKGDPAGEWVLPLSKWQVIMFVGGSIWLSVHERRKDESSVGAV